MKKITNSFIKNIVKQSLNESYGLLNEAITLCPDGGFCIGDKNIQYVNGIKNGGSSYLEKLKNIGNLCNSAKMGKPTFSDNLISTTADKLFELLGKGSAYAGIDEDKVKSQITQMQNFPNFCAIKKIFKEHTNFDLINDYPGGLRSVNSYPFSRESNSANEDTQTYVLSPLVDIINKSITITDNQKKTNSTEEKTNKEKKDAELLVAAKKCGWNTVDEYKKSGWKCEGPKFTVGGGGQNSVSFEGYKCITDHPAKINTPVPLPNGVGYKLDVLNKTINKFIYGVAKSGIDGTDTGVQKDTDSGEILGFDCSNKKIQYSLSTNVWNYSAALAGTVFDEATDKTKIVLTTDPDLEDDNKSNKSIQLESIKGFRYKLLTEAEFKMGDKGPDVGKIQSKLGLPPDKGTPTYGPKTKKAVEDFQSGMKLPVTGVVDDKTMEAINKIVTIESPLELSVAKKSKGDKVTLVQQKLGVEVGLFGPKTEEAVKKFQKKYKLSETGIVDQVTFDKIMAMPGAGDPAKYSGKKHNYTEGQWIKVSPKTDDPQLSGNNGYFKIIKIVNEYSVQIDATFVADGPGGSTQRVLFGEDAKQGTQEVIKSDGDTQDKSGTGRRSASGDNSTGSGTVDPEKQRQRDIRNKEFCDTLRQIKQYLNNTKEADLTVNCKKTQKTINQIMIALSPETPVAPIAPIEEPKVTTPGGNVTVY